MQARRRKAKKAVTMQRSAEDHAIAQMTIWQTNINLTIIVTDNYKRLTAASHIQNDSSNLHRLSHRLAFIYRFHKFIMALKILTRKGKNRDTLFDVRTQLVHCVNSRILNADILVDTQTHLLKLDLTELDKLSATVTSLSGCVISNEIKKLPLYKAIYAEPGHEETNLTPQDIENWLRQTAIPLLNSFTKNNSGFFQTLEHYDASKTVIMMIGDCCPLGINHHSFKDPQLLLFMELSRELRNEYAHKALTKNLDLSKKRERLIKLGLALTKTSAGPHEDAIQSISPFKCSI